MTPPQTNVVVRELGRLGFRFGLLEGGTPDWIARAQARGVSPASLFAVMAQGSEVGKETLYPLRDGILAVTRGLDPHYYNILPLLMALGAITRDEVEAPRNEWRAKLIRAEIGDDPRSSD
jgi:hypothetical protein